MKNVFSGAHKFSLQIPMFRFFISHFGFRRQPKEYFFSKKICQMKAGQYDITKTSGIVHTSLFDMLRSPLSRFAKKSKMLGIFVTSKSWDI